MRGFLIVCVCFIIQGLSALEPHFMSDPTISPDGGQICFSYLDDLWLVPSIGGIATRLTSTPGREWNPDFSPDGRFLAFNTNRDGWSAVYLIDISEYSLKSVSKEGFELLDWFPDGKSMLVARGEPGFRSKFYRLELNGEYREITAFGSRHAAVDKDGDRIIFDHGGLIYREAYQGSFDGEIWEYGIADEKFTRLTDTVLTEQYPVFSFLDDKVYFVASDGENFQLFSSDYQDMSRRDKLTGFKDWSVRDLDIARDKEILVFILFDELWIYDASSSKAKQVQITITEDLLGQQPQKEDVKFKADRFAVAPQANWIAFSYKFDLFAIPEQGGKVIQITSDQKGIADLKILNDNKTIIYTSYKKGMPQLYMVNIEKPGETEYIKWSKNKYIDWIKAPRKRVFIKYTDDEGIPRIALADSTCSEIRDLVEDIHIWDELRLSPDSRFAAYNEIRPGAWTSHIHLHDLEADIDRIGFSSDEHLQNIFWGKDLKSLFFTRKDAIYRQDLLAKEDFYQEEDHWQEILTGTNNQADSKPDSVYIDFEDLAMRVEKIISRPGNNVVVQVINDSLFYFLNEFEDKYTLRKADYFGKSDRSVFTFASEPENLTFNEQNDCFYYIEKDQLKKLVPQSRQTELIPIEFKYSYDSYLLNKDIFDQLWLEFGHRFYDPDMHGVDWDRIYNKYADYLDFVYRQQELKLIVSEMIGEINASHTGFYPRKDEEFPLLDLAYSGFTLDYRDWPDQGFYFKDIYRKSKLAQVYKIKPGDILLSVNHQEVGPGKPLYPLFIDMVGERLELEIISEDSVRTVALEGLNYRDNYRLYYDDWVQERTAMVEEISAGRIGYLHIRAMSESSYEKFLQDLFVQNYEKDALIIDVRNNGGGYIHDKLIEVLTKKPYARITRRYYQGEEMKSPSKLWDKPMVLLINEYSFSDAEIFPYVFRHYGLGKIIGIQTSGSVIGTGHHNFMDGSSMRMPRNGWFTVDGVNLEGNGIEPDIIIVPTPDDLIEDNDIQLQKAVEELLTEIG